MKKSTLWILSAVAVAALVVIGARWNSQRKAAPVPTATTAATAISTAVPQKEIQGKKSTI